MKAITINYDVQVNGKAIEVQSPGRDGVNSDEVPSGTRVNDLLVHLGHCMEFTAIEKDSTIQIIVTTTKKK